MTRIRCHYTDCKFIQEGFCSASEIELDPFEGCLTYTGGDFVPDDELIAEEEDLIEDEGWDVSEFDDEDDDLWLEDEDL